MGVKTPDIKGRIQTEGIGEQGAEENTLTQVG
jgi:hypothetical protein